MLGEGANVVVYAEVADGVGGVCEASLDGGVVFEGPLAFVVGAELHNHLPHWHRISMLLDKLTPVRFLNRHVIKSEIIRLEFLRTDRGSDIHSILGLMESG